MIGRPLSQSPSHLDVGLESLVKVVCMAGEQLFNGRGMRHKIKCFKIYQNIKSFDLWNTLIFKCLGI